MLFNLGCIFVSASIIKDILLHLLPIPWPFLLGLPYKLVNQIHKLHWPLRMHPMPRIERLEFHTREKLLANRNIVPVNIV